MSSEELPLPRRNWRTCEPYHGFVYFAPEAAARYEALGLEGMSGYFASRSAALGAVTAPTVAATFYNFDPAMVQDAMHAIPADLQPDAVLDARYAAVDEVLRSRLGDAIGSVDMREAADLATKAQSGIEQHCAGRPLAWAHAWLPQPDEDHLRLWWAITALREFRGDGHIAALVDAEISGIEALVLHAATGEVPRAVLQSTRGWSDDAWGEAVHGLAARGLVDVEGAFTDAGRALRDHVEARTDALAVPAWQRLTEDDSARLRRLVRPWSRAVWNNA